MGRVRTHRHPTDLGPQVPEVKCGRGAHRQLLQNVLILQGLALCREASQGSGAARAFTHCHRGAQRWRSRWLYSLGSRRRDWRAGYHCGSVGRAERHSAQTGRAQPPHNSPVSDKASVARGGPWGSRIRQGRVQAEVGCPGIAAKVFLLIATRGRRHRQAHRGLSHRGAAPQALWSGRLTGGVPPGGP